MTRSLIPQIEADGLRSLPAWSRAGHVAELGILILAAVYDAPYAGILFLIALAVGLAWSRVRAQLIGLAAVAAAIVEQWPLAILIGAWLIIPYVFGAIIVWRNRDALVEDQRRADAG